MGIPASLIFLTYNQEKYVYDALVSVLNQDYEDLEIVISDDCSTDASWNIITKTIESYIGNKKIILNKNESNIGIVGNYKKSFNLSSGELVFIAHGDDISLVNRCSENVFFWKNQENKYDLVASDAYDMLEDGTVMGVKKTDNLEDWNNLKWFEKRPFFFGASHMITRNLFFGNKLNQKLPVEDQSLVFRALLMNGAVRLAKPLVMHRRGGLSQNSKNFITKHKELTISCAGGLIESQQMLDDAVKFKCCEKVIDSIKKNYTNSLYGCNILNASNLKHIMSLFLMSNDVTLSKRFRFAMYAMFPNLLQKIIYIKKMF